ncbi:MAG: ankyrin repeat domain-containing protein [Armatimonadetes bacterium]|nr:ankyrin repeat domain-containing protein [Armatimonadota bacterium]
MRIWSVLLCLLLAGCTGSTDPSPTPASSGSPVAGRIPITDEFKPLFEKMEDHEDDAFPETIEAVKSHPELARMVDEDGYTLLHRTVDTYAGAEQKPELVRILLENGADPHLRDGNGTPPIAGDYLDARTLQVLLEHGADVNAQGNGGRTALMQVSKPEQVKLLLEHKADVHLRDGGGQYALHKAAHRRDNAIPLMELLVAAGADVNRTDDDGEAAVHVAAYDGNWAAVEWLMGKGAKVTGTYRDGPTLLFKCPDEMVAAELIAQGVDVKATDEDGDTALHVLARRSDRSEVIKLLVSKGADVDAHGWEGFTPLHQAVIGDSSENVKVLLSCGADVNARNEHGQTPLHWGRIPLEIAEQLVANGADIHARDESGETPLHVAIGVPLMELLVAKGADIHARNKAGETPIQTTHPSDDEARAFLKKRGAR